MEIEVLHTPDCGNYKKAAALIREVLDEMGVSAPVREIEVSDQETAEAKRFLGSPTVQIDGVDVDPRARNATGFSTT